MYIREASKKDFDILLNLHLQLEDAEIAFDSNLVEKTYDTDKGRKRLKKHFEEKKNLIFVMVEDDKVVGFIDGYIADDAWWYKETVAFINYLCVDKEYRNRGIAQQLLDKFAEYFKAKNVKYIRLLAFPNNTPAIKFYKKNQFTEYSTYYNKILK